MNVEIAERLARRRREAGFSQEELAARLSVSRQAVSKWERSESSPDTDNLIALAKIYGVSLDDLLYVDESIEEDVCYEATDRGGKTSAASNVSSTGSAKRAPGADDGEDAARGRVHDAVGGRGEKADAQGSSETFSKAKEERSEKSTQDYVHIGPAGIHVEDGDDSVHISWSEGVHVLSSEGDQVHVGWDGIHVVDAQGKVRVGGARPFVPAAKPRKIASLIGGIYPLAATGWFFWMAFAQNAPHPAWVIFLTIPLVEWAIVRISKWWHRR